MTRISQFAITFFLLLSSYTCYAEETWATLNVRIATALKAHDYAQAEQLALQTLQLFESGQETNIHKQVYSLDILGEIYHAENKIAPAENTLRKAYETSLSAEGDKPVIPRVTICDNLVEVLLDDSKVDEADALLHSCLPKDPPQSFESTDFETRSKLVRVLQFKGKMADAEAMARDQLQYAQKLLPADSREIQNSLNILSLCIQRQDLGRRLGEALGYMQQAWAGCVKTSGDTDLRCVTFEDNLGELLSMKRDFDSAEKHILHALEERKSQLGEDHPFTASTAFNLGRLYSIEDRLEEAVPILQKVVDVFKATYGKKSKYLEDVQTWLVNDLRKLGRDKEARKLERENGLWIVN